MGNWANTPSAGRRGAAARSRTPHPGGPSPIRVTPPGERARDPAGVAIAPGGTRRSLCLENAQG